MKIEIKTYEIAYICPLTLEPATTRCKALGIIEAVTNFWTQFAAFHAINEKAEIIRVEVVE